MTAVLYIANLSCVHVEGHLGTRSEQQEGKVNFATVFWIEGKGDAEVASLWQQGL